MNNEPIQVNKLRIEFIKPFQKEKITFYQKDFNLLYKDRPLLP